MMVYILKIEPPYKGAGYYVGFCEEGNLLARYQHHVKGTGARLTRAASRQGHRLYIIMVFPGANRQFERWIHNRKNTPRWVQSIIKKSQEVGHV